MTVSSPAKTPSIFVSHGAPTIALDQSDAHRFLTRFPDAPLRDLDRAFIDRSLVPALRGVIETKRPAIDLVKTSMVGIRVGYERLMIPQKTAGTPQWCVSLAEGRFAIPFHQEAKTDLTDDGIVQLLIEGHTAREIADMLHLSPRTIEHRIDRMKARHEAKNLVHLVAKLVGAQLDRRDVG